MTFCLFCKQMLQQTFTPLLVPSQCTRDFFHPPLSGILVISFPPYWSTLCSSISILPALTKVSHHTNIRQTCTLVSMYKTSSIRIILGMKLKAPQGKQIFKLFCSVCHQASVLLMTKCRENCYMYLFILLLI